MDTNEPGPQLTCPACGHVTAYDPARCRHGARTRHGKDGRPEKTTFLWVRCGGCGAAA
jgi:ribosomal protein S27E